MDDYPPYITAAQRRRRAQAALETLKKEGYDPQPIKPFTGNTVAKTFWGHAWCRHLEAFSDYQTRLPRGRSYLRHGSVCHLEITPGRVHAMVLGAERYEVSIAVAPLDPQKWDALKTRCAGKVSSLVELLKGKLPPEVMRHVTHPHDGLFPLPQDIRLSCDCPDHADLCKHLAAALYGIGRRLDDQPELLFTLRHVDQSELIATQIPQAPGTSRRRIAASSLGDVFGIDLDPATATESRSDLGREPPAPPAKIPHAQKPLKPKNAKPKTFTGADIAQLRETFGMTPYELAVIAQVSSATVTNWEAKGDAPLRLRAPHKTTLATLAALSSEAAWDRLNELS